MRPPLGIVLLWEWLLTVAVIKPGPWAVCGGLTSPLVPKETYQKGCCSWETLDLDLFVKEVKSFAMWALRGSAEQWSPPSLCWAAC